MLYVSVQALNIPDLTIYGLRKDTVNCMLNKLKV